MSSFKVMSTKSRLKLGIAVVVIIHIGMFYGFWRVHAKQIGDKVYEMDIYAAPAAQGLTFYEAIPTADCVKVLNEQAPKLGMPIVEEPAADSTGTDTAKNSSNKKDGTTKTQPKEVKLAPSLYYASSPTCKSIATVPAGAEKLGADGFVGLELNIDKDGVVKRGEISRSSGFAELDDAALKQATENLSFKPCHKGDAAVGCKQIIKYRWKIQ
ncbi:energy transducer TonB [Cellvibrio sp.]|uniref:energy transducer TonB n=1 Tax=Cellvibrio sp. TaxID=1965322 RepID=UPI0039647B71